MIASNIRAWVRLCGLMALLVSAKQVEASGFALLEQSASRLGTAFAGTAATADDATAVYFNPAGMSRLHSADALILASGIEITSEFRNTGSAAALGQPLGGSGGDAGDWNFVPGAYLAAPLNDRIALGIGINAPFGLKLVYDDGWVGRFQAIRSEIVTLNANPSISYRINDHISLGAGVSFQRLEAELTNAVNYSAAVAQGAQQLVVLGRLPLAAVPGVLAANAGLEGRARVRGDDDRWGFNLGAIIEPTETTRIGLSYRSTLDYKVRGTVRFTAAQSTEPVGAGIIAAASASGGALSNGPVSVDLKLPDSALVSLHQGVGERLALLADIAWTGWSSIQELRVVRDTGSTVSVTPERWKDTWRYALGAAYSVTDAVLLRAGVAYDETPVPDATRTPRLPDPDRTWVAVGARWQPVPAIIIDVGYAHLFSDTVPLSQNAGSTAASGLILGEQESDIDIVSAQLIYRF